MWVARASRALPKKKATSRVALFFGAENETRTRDPNLGKVVLYQLSYFRLFAVANVGNFFHSPNFLREFRQNRRD